MVEETHSPSSSTKPPKPNSLFFTHYFFSKSLTLILLLLLLSFFPSQLPEFFNKTTILTKLWDLFYLLVIGITVCYGLFSRKIDTLHTSHEPIPSDDTYFSQISHISSIFEEGVQNNAYGFEEKPLLDQVVKGSDGKKLNQYFLGESMVVINDQNFVLEQLNTTKRNKNIGSRSLDSAAAGKSVVLEDSSGGWDEIKSTKLRGLVPTKLEEKFKETDSGSDSDSDSSIPLKWRSKSMRLGKKEDMGGIKPNERAVSGGVLDFEDLKAKSKSMRLGKKEDMGGVKPNERAVSGGVLDFEDLKSKPKSTRVPMPLKRNLSEKEEVEMNNHNLSTEASFVESEIQESNADSFTEMNDESNCTEVLKGFSGTWDASSEETLKEFGKNKVLKGFNGTLDPSSEEYLKEFGKSKVLKGFNGTLDASSEENLKEFGKNKVEDDALDLKRNTQFVKSKSQSSSVGESSETNVKTVANTYRRGKSVRTNRSKEQVVEAKVNRIQTQTNDKGEPISKPGIDVTTVNSDELSDTEPHSGEVDRKAEEFIAKFKEQIRLQKVASARKQNIR